MTDDWSLCPLSAVAPVIKRGRAPSYADEGILVLNQKCVRPGNVIDYSVARRTDPSVKAIPEWAFLQVGDVLVNSTGRGTAGRAALVAQVRERATVDSHVTIVRSDTDLVVPAFVGIVLSSMPDTLEQLATGSTTQVELSRESIGQVILRLPPLSQQRRIVDLIGSIDTCIDRLEGQIAATRTARAGMLSGVLSNSAKDWQSSTLGDVANWTSGGTPKAGETAFYGGIIPWCVIGDLTEGQVTHTAKTLTTDGLSQSSAKLNSAGTVMLAMYGASIGRTGIAGVQMATNQAIASAQVDESKIEGRFLLLFLQSQKEHFVSRGAGAAQPNISLGLIRSWPVLLPPLHEQQRVVALIDSFDRQVEDLRSQVGTVRALRSALLSELLAGARLLDDSYDTAVGL